MLGVLQLGWAASSGDLGGERLTEGNDIITTAGPSLVFYETTDGVFSMSIAARISQCR